MSKLKLGIICTMAMATLVAACGPSGERPDESGEIMIIQIDEQGGMRFEPENIVLTAGQAVRIVLENQGEKDHEFMIGQNVIRMDDGELNGFEIDFFEGIEDMVTVMLGEGAMLMIDDQMVMMDEDMAMDEDEDMAMDEDEDMAMDEDEEMAMDEDEEMAMDKDEEMAMEEQGVGHAGWMVMDNAGSQPTVIEFVIPLDRVGEWEMACFQDDGTHYEDGMRGTITVVAP